MLVSGGTAVAHYIDGIQRGYSSVGLGPSNSNDITIGAVDYPTNGSPVGNFKGYIDEVSLFDTHSTALTTALSTSLPTDLTSLNPLGWWRMGDGSDGSGNADGTLVNIDGTNFPQIYNMATDGSGNRITGIDGSLTNIASANGIVPVVKS